MNPVLSVFLQGAAPAAIVGALLLIIFQWIPREGWWRVLPIALVLALTVRYLGWRILATLPPVSDKVDFFSGVLFLAIEFVAVSGSIASYVSLSRSSNRSRDVDANAQWFASLDPVPLVDVFICTYNEERDILERTILGAMGMAYPNFRVWVLDDGRRSWLAELAASTGCRYLTRPDNANAKAGNINNALRHVSALADPPDFISILDADFVPTRQFLTRTMRLFREEDVGIVQTPQHFINPDPIQANLLSSDVWPDEQRYFFDVLMPAKDAWGTAFCCGTSSVIRMSALREAGGFPTESVTEDYLLTLRLRQFGYRTIYLNEPLSFGLAPEGLNEYVTQRSRWALGFAQIIRGRDSPFARNKLGFIDRFGLIESMLYWTGAYLFRVAALVIPILYLLFDIHAVDVGTADAIAYFLPYYLAQSVVMSWLSGRRVMPVLTDVSQLLSAREIMAAFFTGLFLPKGQKFRVTAKGGDRSSTVVQWRMMAIFAVFYVLTLTGVIFAFSHRISLQDSSAIALFWSWYNIVVLSAAIVTCIERPRLRRHGRLLGTLPVRLSADGRLATYHTHDISLGGLRLKGEAPAPVGTLIQFELDNVRLGGRIVRVSPRDFAIAAETSLNAQTAMLRIVYSGNLKSTVDRVRSGQIAGKLLLRLFG